MSQDSGHDHVPDQDPPVQALDQEPHNYIDPLQLRPCAFVSPASYRFWPSPVVPSNFGPPVAAGPRLRLPSATASPHQPLHTPLAAAPLAGHYSACRPPPAAPLPGRDPPWPSASSPLSSLRSASAVGPPYPFSHPATAPPLGYHLVTALPPSHHRSSAH
ncbi:classical arabinogalactan protein 9-like [Cryptomeria japonica]|uniref:classical arabinogalactan protein 9-like n=1 Tax=Cryptomeria japonica TaxID=3369 RepID=UPI0027DA2852|nr:classical arabinogalactan protein 9-like [Cryptomeria japonica]